MKDFQKNAPSASHFAQRIEGLYKSRFPNCDPKAIPVFTLAHTLSVLLEQFQSRSFKSLGHTHSTFAIITMLSIVPDEDQMTPAQLGEMLGQTSGGMNKTLKKLDEMGFIERMPNPTDKRSVMISLTQEGVLEADRICPVIARNHLRKLSSMSPEEMSQVISALEILIRALGEF